MGFNDVLARWQRDGRIADFKHCSSARDTFRGRYPQAYWNLDKDQRVTDLQRECLLTMWLGCDPTSIDEVERMYVQLCRSHKQRKGPRRRLRRAQVLGHCISESTMVNRVSNASRSGFMPMPRAMASVAAFLRMPLDRQRRYLERYGIRDHLMWSFYEASTPNDPFAHTGTTEAELHRRLGLGHYDLHGDRLLYVKHRLPAGINAHIPTTFDAETSPYFAPGGRTRPLTGPKGDGVNEAVHLPIPGSAIVSRVIEAS